MLGANDALLCQRLTPPCLDPATVSGIAAHVAQNLGFILRELRSTGYSGRIVAVTYYSLNYADPLLTGDTGILDSAIAAAATANGARVASGFLAFLGPSLRAGGDPVAANLVLANDDHPTPTGHRLLARTVEQAMGL
jgi:lysophospholipase L1-like esterase